MWRAIFVLITIFMPKMGISEQRVIERACEIKEITGRHISPYWRVRFVEIHEGGERTTRLVAALAYTVKNRRKMRRRAMGLCDELFEGEENDKRHN